MAKMKQENQPLWHLFMEYYLGFQLRLHSELRYEPKNGANYGGQLTVISQMKEKWL